MGWIHRENCSLGLRAARHGADNGAQPARFIQAGMFGVHHRVTEGRAPRPWTLPCVHGRESSRSPLSWFSVGAPFARQSPGLRRRSKRTFGRSSALTVSIATAQRTRSRAGSICDWCDFKSPAEIRARQSRRTIRSQPSAGANSRRRNAAERREAGAQEIDTIARWIAGGAKTERPEPESIAPGLGITAEERSWWAFQPIVRPAVSAQATDPRVRTPIDALLRASMPSGLSFSPDADKRSLILRAYFDLLGLPPTPEEVEQFVTDESADAYEQLIDRLLASPHYGERWARHWLDAAGYADSDGGATQDAVRTWAYKYRDYVIRAFNADKPFDRFLQEQLAGDELAGPINGDLTPSRSNC